jgi:hypothetical protein
MTNTNLAGLGNEHAFTTPLAGSAGRSRIQRDG